MNLRATNQFNAGIAIFAGNGVYVERITANDIWGDAVLQLRSDAVLPSDPSGGTPSTDVRVRSLTATRHTRQCVAFSDVTGASVEDSTCRNSWYGGVDLEADFAGQSIKDVHVLRNTFDGYYFYAVAIPRVFAQNDVQGVEVRGNRTLSPPDTCRSPIIVKAEEDTSANTVLNATVTENTLKTLYNGIELRDVASGSVTGDSITITVSPNYCGPPAGVPVKLVRSPNVAVSGNTFIGYS